MEKRIRTGDKNQTDLSIYVRLRKCLYIEEVKVAHQ